MKTQKDDPYFRVNYILLLYQNERRFKFIQANSQYAIIQGIWQALTVKWQDMETLQTPSKTAHESLI